MTTFLITILCLNIDALSYGISYGISKIKINLKYIFFITIISTILFAIPLAISKYIYTLFNKKILEIINGIILIILGLSYILKKSEDLQTKKQGLNFKTCFFECIAISVDAIFTAILSGFSANYFIFSVFFYALTNFFAIFFGNLFFYNFQNKLRINLSFFSGFIFIFLGFLKCIGI